MQQNNTTTHFLSGGGELGKLIRAFNWSSTGLGTTDQWPLSLQIILRLLLSSKQPMFVWWGPNLIQFYNDAYREILGNDGKHPLALGQKAKDCWVEIWPVIHPLILKVLAGEPCSGENQLIPIFRNGMLDEVYWTFAYTPLHNDSGKIEGVLVTCNETTKNVVSHKQLALQINHLLLQAPIAICTFYGKDLVIESVNEKMMQLWGRSNKKEVLGIPLFKALPETADQGLKELLDRTFDTGEPYVTPEQEVKLLHDGKLKQFFLKVMYQPLLDDKGKVVGIMGLADDITDVVNKRKKTAENELRARIAIASAELGTYEVNLLTKQVTGNKQFYKLMNLDTPEKKEDFITQLYPYEPETWEKMYKSIFASGKLSYEKKIIYPDHTLHWLKIHGKVVVNKLKNPVKIFGIVDDITQPKLLTEEKNELLARQVVEAQRLQLFESVISHIKDGAIIIEIITNPFLSHKIIYCNDALKAISGFTKMDVAGKTLELFNGTKTDSCEWNKLKTAIANKEVCEVELISYKKNKEVFWNNMCTSPVIDNHGNYTHCIVTFRDITLRKQKDKDLSIAIFDTQEKERFQIASELHDNVNQLLVGVLLSLGMTQNNIGPTQKIQVDQSISYLRLAIEEIRRISHWLAPVYLDGKTLVESFQKLLENINSNQQFVIKFKNENIINSDINNNIQLNLYRILQEQMTNIIKYSKASIIEVTLKRGLHDVLLSIMDNGIGINTEKFQEGIGLNNIRKRVELLSGNFSLLSSIGNGCAINIKIPLNA